jgi:metallo-beta-lactamase family protein
MRISFHGAAGEVTGSCTLIETDKTRVLVDCGMFQGSHDSYPRNLEAFSFDPRTIDAVVITHAHIDHIGRIPKLVKEGFKGRIFAVHPTRLFAKLMWQDAAHVMKDDARRHDKPAIYLPKEVPAVYELVHGVGYDANVQVSGDVSFRFRESGHIFGSAFVEFDAGGIRLACSGDLGNDLVPILRPTESITDADIVVSESTYGDRVHEDPKARAARLEQAVLETVRKNGVLLIPAFSLERSQEILYELNEMVESGRVPKIPMFLDSPLAIRVLPIYRQFPEYYDTEAKALKKAGDDFFQFPGLHVTKKPEESQAIIEVPPPKVVIAGSGMMHGGRIMHHLVEYLNDPRNTVLVVGYQSAGTVGRSVVEGAKKVHIEHQDVNVRANIEVIGAYSAHADQPKILKWINSGKRQPSTVYLNHGEPHAQEVLADRLRADHGLDVRIPAMGEGFEHS